MTEREERSLHCASAKSADAPVGMTSGVGGNNCRIVRIVELASEWGDSRVGGFAGVAIVGVDLDGFVGGAAHCGRLAPVADQPTTLVKVPISSMEMRISSEGCKVKASGGTMPVPVSKKQPEGKTLSRKR